MKKFIFAIGIVVALGYSLFATEITVSSKEVANWRFGGTTARLGGNWR